LAELPVFPLPATVLFPGTVLPLHVFEPRYVNLVEDQLADQGMLGIVMLDESRAAEGEVTLCEIACAGRLVHHEKTTGGYNVLVHGIQRVRLAEEVAEKNGYRCFRAEPIPRPTHEALHEATRELARLQSCVLSLRAAVEATDHQLVEVLGATSDPLALADILSAVLVVDPHQRQRLLAERNLRARLAKLIDVVADVMVRVGQVPATAKAN